MRTISKGEAESMLSLWVDYQRGDISLAPAYDPGKTPSTFDVMPDDPEYITFAVIQVELALKDRPNFLKSIRKCYFTGGHTNWDWEVRKKLISRIQFHSRTNYNPETIVEYAVRVARRKK